MTQNDIVDMARDSGMELYGLGKNRARFVHHLEAFAKLVAAKERDACAMLCLWHNNTMSQNPTLFHMAELIRARTGDKE